MDNQVHRSPANSMQKKFKPTYETCQDTERVFPMLAWPLLSRAGTRAAALISSAVTFLECSRVFLPFYSSPTEKLVMLFNVTSQLSHHFNFFQGEAPHTETQCYTTVCQRV